jgi:hypothetical protein
MAELPDGHISTEHYKKVWFQNRWYFDDGPYRPAIDMEEHIRSLAVGTVEGLFIEVSRSKLPNGDIVVVFRWKRK